MRVVSLLPPATELLFALGVEPVAVSHECDYPPAVKEKPAANRSRIEPGGTTADIDAAVSQAVAEHGGVYEVDDVALRRADPDLILTQGVCEVCAVDDSLVEAAIERLDLDAAVVSTHPHDLDGVLRDIERIGGVVGRPERAAALVADLSERIEAVRRRAAGLNHPRVAVLDWTDPVMVAGHWVPGMVETAGGDYGLAASGDRSRPRRWEAVRRYDPEALVVAPCGFSLDEAMGSGADLTGRAGWDDLAAVRDGRVYAMDGNAHLNRPGPRLVDSLEHLAGLLHPDRFDAPPADVARSL